MRWLIDSGTKLLCFLRRRQRIRPAGEVVKINLGSALNVAPLWIHIDGSFSAFIAGWPKFLHAFFYRFSGQNQYSSFDVYHRLLKEHAFVHHNLEYGIPLTDDSAHCVYSSHFLEHLTKSDGEHLIAESYRVLKKGGRLRLAVPDLTYAVSLYAKGDKERMLEDYFFVNHRNSYFARHKYMYDFDLLKKLLERNGFENIVRCSYQQGETPDLEVLDNRPEETLFVEAVK
jgi:predicted SAM-dependent methyltransferase